MIKPRAQRTATLEAWAERVQSDDLVVADTETLRLLVELVEQRERVETALADAVCTARGAHKSWSEIGAMLGVSKQAAQRKYARKASA